MEKSERVVWIEVTTSVLGVRYVRPVELLLLLLSSSKDRSQAVGAPATPVGFMQVMAMMAIVRAY